MWEGCGRSMGGWEGEECGRFEGCEGWGGLRGVRGGKVWGV